MTVAGTQKILECFSMTDKLFLCVCIALAKPVGDDR